MAQSLQQQRAAFVYERVRMWDRAWQKEAAQQVKGLPVQVRMQGLATTVAVLLSEDRSHTRALAELLATWLLERAQRRPFGHLDASATPRGLLEACIQADRATYTAVQTEALALLETVKLLADALYGGNPYAA